MSEQINLYKITKRTNSTKQPVIGNLQGTYLVTLKDGSSINNPIFELNEPATFNKLSRCNYIKWIADVESDKVDNFYWIDDITLDYDSYITIRCHRDPLATFKDSITGYNGFVARSNLNYDSMISDPNILVLPNLIHEETVTVGMNNYFGVTQDKTSITWTTIGIDGCSTFNTVVASNITLNELLNPAGGSSIWNNFQWGVTNPGQYIKDVIMLPFRFNSGDYVNGLQAYVGNLKASLSWSYFLDGEASGSVPTDFSPDAFKQIGVNVSKPTLAYPVNDFRNYSDTFTNLKMMVPFLGAVNIPAKHLKAHHFEVLYYISILTGKGKCIVNACYSSNDPNVFNDVMIIRSNIETGVPISVAAGHTNQLEMARDAINIARTGSDILGAVTRPSPAGLLDTAINVASTSLETAAHAAAGYQEYTSLGSNGSLVEAFNYCNDIKLIIQQHDSTSTDFSQERGRPVYLKRTNSAGFVQFLSPSLQPPGATQTEINEINATLASGIFIE